MTTRALLSAPAAARLRTFVTAWMQRRDGSGENPVVLTQRRIFILPTREGLVFLLILLALFVASVNYNLNLGYVLTFFLSSMVLVALLHTFRNLSRLEVSPGKAEPVFAGADALFQVHLFNPTRLPRNSVGIKFAGVEQSYTDVMRDRAASLQLRISTKQRGWLQAGRFTLFTRYPLGLFHAWSHVQLDLRCLVYPRVDAGAAAVPLVESAQERGASAMAGDEDFSGLRTYRPGDAPRQIAWKAFAREQGLFSKYFSSPATHELWLDWDALPGLDTEARLSRLTRWALEAHGGGAAFGLKLPGQVIGLNAGERQLHEVLRALALYQLG